MSGIGAPLRLYRMLLCMSYGMDASLMCPTFEFGAVLPMCMSRRTRGIYWSPTWRMCLSRLSQGLQGLEVLQPNYQTNSDLREG